MDWKLSWTEEAMSAGHDDVLELMLRYRQNMVEEAVPSLYQHAQPRHVER
jgi:hypothetical protein